MVSIEHLCSLDRTWEAALRAVAQDANSRRAHTTLAQVYFFRHEFEALFDEDDRSIELNPNNSGFLATLGQSLHSVGDDREMALVKKAMQLDPFHPMW